MATGSKSRRDAAAAKRASGTARSTLLWVFIIFGALLVAGAFSTTSLTELVGSGFSSPSEVTETSNAPGTDAALPVDMALFGIDDLRKVIGVLNEAERARVIEDKAAFAQLAQRETARRALMRAAQQAGLVNRPEVAFLMQRNAEQVLVDTYLQLSASAALSADFPDEAQVREFYESNKARYRLDERIPVWQIFISVPEGADNTTIAEIEKRAKTTAKALKSGKLTFAEAAARGSDHKASRHNGGFMGNLGIGELIPEIKSVVLKATPGDISGPVRSAAGFHLLKRGERIEAEILTLDQVAPQIRKTLRQAAENRARQVVISQAQKQYGATMSEADLERWRHSIGRTPTRPAQTN